MADHNELLTQSRYIWINKLKYFFDMNYFELLLSWQKWYSSMKKKLERFRWFWSQKIGFESQKIAICWGPKVVRSSTCQKMFSLSLFIYIYLVWVTRSMWSATAMDTLTNNTFTFFLRILTNNRYTHMITMHTKYIVCTLESNEVVCTNKLIWFILIFIIKIVYIYCELFTYPENIVS